MSERSSFIERSILSLLGALAALRERPGKDRRGDLASAELKLASALLVILLVSLSRDAFFLEAAAAFELLCLCLLPGDLIARVLRKALAAGLFALAIFLPAFLIGRGAGLPILVAKIVLALLAAATFSTATSWPSIASALSSFRVPDLFLLTLDMTVKYISLLGGLLLDMLYALKLRSVGRSDRKRDSLGAIAGTVFLKSKEASLEQYQAMECRCFSGSYRRRHRLSLGWRDACLAGADLLLLALFLLGVLS